jgi:hypothetical protein
MTTKLKKEKLEIVHRDIFGKEILLGTNVVFCQNNSLMIGEIVKINPKMIRVTPVGNRSSYLKYPSDTVVVDGPTVTMYILKNSA